MPSPTLFPLDEPLTATPERDEPVLWLKRLLVLPDLDSDTPIREVPFRRGLNIIQTRQRTAGEKTVVGHSVGKTLLLRLIRYTLGEQHYAVEQVRTRIASRFGTAHVVAHWRVGGVDWIVVRPLQEARSSKSFAVKSDDWRAAIANKPEHLSFSDFLTAVSDAALTGLSDFTLPRARRSPKWLDVLGWFARDYECGYRAPNEWRHADASSTPGLDREDNSIVLQWIAGLMGTEEIKLKHAHQKLLDDRQTAKSNRDAAQKTIEVTGPELFSKLEYSEDQDAADDTEGLFAAKVVETADEKIKSLLRLKDERVDKSTLGELESTEETARKAWIAAEAGVLALARQVQFLEGRIEQLTTADSTTLYALRSPFEDCPSSSCPMRLENRPTPYADAAKDEQLAALREELSEFEHEVPTRQSGRDECEAAYASARTLVRTERQRLSGETSGIDREVGRWQSYKKDAENYQRARATVSDSDTAIEKLDKKIEKSNQAQESVRENIKNQINRLSSSYDSILKQVFGDTATGSVVVDGKGLRPVPDNRLAPNGAALSIMTTVLAFDLSSVAASVGGIGHHPRFLLHDSPREGDMEEPLFQQLFQVARDLELLFHESEPSFQYIVTTTTPPPEELADEAGPYVRLTLDARRTEDHLLRESF